ncbi:hypothetical protein HELRODRAFT_159135 [Helobdella robusta]|uniref:Secreted protein n=1 Tax=Helobdella robusta TaxID=6412 RepID=T1ENM8_HELRO|nr:hypothetical protein HELRODRAFT_159135 [Helobdella robusta]ESO12575.1 hypothetical protein HELRODRAFT_159135 [Helobdella robusta]
MSMMMVVAVIGATAVTKWLKVSCDESVAPLDRTFTGGKEAFNQKVCKLALEKTNNETDTCAVSKKEVKSSTRGKDAIDDCVHARRWFKWEMAEVRWRGAGF